MRRIRRVRVATLAGLCISIATCNKSSSSPPGTTLGGSDPNVLTFTINAGPNNSYFNGGFAAVTVCAPGSTTTCQTIDGVLIDTGSSGLRVLSSVLTVPLRQQMSASGNPIAECSQFVDGFTLGPVELADVKLAGEQAVSAPIQVVGASGFPNIPAACTDTGLTSEQTLQDLGANGILGIGLFQEDCGTACSFSGANNPGFYFQCQADTCTATTVATSAQLQNPVALFAQDNNGVVITIPTVPRPGLVSASGTLIFGIGTRSNNGLGNARVHTVAANGNFSTVFNGQTYASFLDTGSNGYYFLDTNTTGLPACPSNNDFYCPTTSQSLSAVNRGTNGASSMIAFTIDNAESLPGSLNVLPTIGGSNVGEFDWGMPFFFGRTVFTGIENRSTPGGTGPFWAY